MTSIIMNHNCRDLLKYFLTQYPGIDEGAFKIVVDATLKGHNIPENFENMSVETALMFSGIFLRVSEEHLVDWIFGIFAYEKNKSGEG